MCFLPIGFIQGCSVIHIQSLRWHVVYWLTRCSCDRGTAVQYILSVHTYSTSIRTTGTGPTTMACTMAWHSAWHCIIVCRRLAAPYMYDCTTTVMLSLAAGQPRLKMFNGLTSRGAHACMVPWCAAPCSKSPTDTATGLGGPMAITPRPRAPNFRISGV